MSDASDAAAMYAKECADLRARLAAAESERNEAKRTEDLHGEHDAEIIDRLRAELEAARRQIDDARKDGYAIGLMDAKDMLSDTESPIAWQYRDKNSDWHTINLVRNKHQRDYLEKNSDRYELRPLYAAPVPPQPAVSVAGVIAAYECGMQSTDHLNQYAHGTAEHDAFVHGVNHRYALAHMAAQTQHFAVPEAVAKDAIRAQRIADDICVICGGPHHTMQDAILSAADDEVKKCAHVIPCPDVCGDNTNSTATEGRKDE